ncbi:hypothetical protein [Leuconostoc carnosum]|uniref:hypothetical protein n=1 Tax=Leuconostoc carnosum TaxID=1252 RepID=UPI000D5240FC|nr:hypothetical protein [Leuconostoc carnosum]SPJ44079.1 conserved hypothetical protein [Leuconostoc carnosum]
MADKKVYAWAYEVRGVGVCGVTTIENVEKRDYFPLYSIEEVQHVIENNELPKRPVALVYWDNTNSYKHAVKDEHALSLSWEHEVPVYSADELLAELQKEI